MLTATLLLVNSCAPEDGEGGNYTFKCSVLKMIKEWAASGDLEQLALHQCIFQAQFGLAVAIGLRLNLVHRKNQPAIAVPAQIQNRSNS